MGRAPTAGGAAGPDRGPCATSGLPSWFPQPYSLVHYARGEIEISIQRVAQSKRIGLGDALPIKTESGPWR
jgi:hypothetical protein